MRFLSCPSLVFVAFLAVFGATPARAQNLAPAPIACHVGGVSQTVAGTGDRTADTANIQNAIDACSVVGTQAGRPVFVQLLPGNFVIKPITMRSYTFLLIPAGVVGMHLL